MFIRTNYKYEVTQLRHLENIHSKVSLYFAPSGHLVHQTLHINLSLHQAQANPEGLQSLNIVVPVDPRHTAEEWIGIMGVRRPSPGHLPVFKPKTGLIMLSICMDCLNYAACCIDVCKTCSFALREEQTIFFSE
jgi:hypothetical protein